MLVHGESRDQHYKQLTSAMSCNKKRFNPALHTRSTQVCHTGTHMATEDVLLQLLSVQLLGLCVITHKPLVTMRDVKAAVKSTLCDQMSQVIT